jgi:hypothetical protein
MTYDDLKIPFLVALAAIVGMLLISPLLLSDHRTRAERAAEYKKEMAEILRSCDLGSDCAQRLNDLTARINAAAAAHPLGD